MSVDIELRKAAALINAGRIESARSILSDYLKDFPESDLAWLLMSYVLDDPRKQQAAATRALRLNPKNDQAKARIDQLLQIQSPSSPEITSEHFSSDFERYYPDQDPLAPLQEETSPPMSIEDRLAFVTLEAETADSKHSRDYPSESLLSNGTRISSRGPTNKLSRKSTIKSAIRIMALGFLLIAIIFLGVKFISGGFISEADALETAIAETVSALASENAGVHLPATWTPTITLDPISTSTRVPTGTPTVTPSMIPPAPTIGAEVETLQQQVADIRQLSIREEVDTGLIHRTRVRAFMENYYTSLTGSEEEIAKNGHVLVALGLIEPSYDLLTNVLNSLIDGIGGFYLHETNELYVIGSQFEGIEKFIYSHEYGHALVDQNYNLSEMGVYPLCAGNEDRCKAVQAVIEGDATLLMLQWLEEGATVSEYNEILRYNPPSQILSEQAPPPFALRNNEFTYSNGQAFVEELYARGEWAAVNQVYSRLPSSTEQILHPEKYFSGEPPIVVPNASLETIVGADWELIKSNTLGEWLTYLILGYGTDPKAQLNEGDAVLASKGWGGDQYQVYYNQEDEETVLVVHWKWDQPSDADEFASGMRYYLKKRFSEGEVVELNRECWHGNDQFSCLYDGHQQSLWIMAPSMELLDALGELYTEF